MSEEVAVPVPSPVASIAAKLGMEAPAAPEQPKANVVQAISDRMKGLRSARLGVAEEAPPAGEPAKAEPKAEEPKAEEPKAEEPKQDKLKEARTIQALAKAEKQALELKTKFEAAEKRWNEAESLAKSNPIKAMEKLSGMSFKEIMAEAAKGKFDVKPLDPELDARLKKIEEFEQKQRKAEEEQATAAQRSADHKLVSDLLTSRADEFPMFSAFDWAADQLLEMAYEHLKETGEQPDLSAMAAEQEKKAVEGLEKLLKNEKIKGHPRIKALLGAPAAALPAKSQPTMSNATAAEAPAPSETKKKHDNGEIDPEVIAKFQQWKRGHGFGR